MSQEDGMKPDEIGQRVALIMKVQSGRMTATDAACELGISCRQYYRLQETMLIAAVKAVAPGKRGPRIVREDPRIIALKEEVARLARERELLEIKVKDLEEVNQEMKARSLGVGEEKKRAPRSRRPPVSDGLPSDGSGNGNGVSGQEQEHFPTM